MHLRNTSCGNGEHIFERCLKIGLLSLGAIRYGQCRTLRRRSFPFIHILRSGRSISVCFPTKGRSEARKEPHWEQIRIRGTHGRSAGTVADTLGPALTHCILEVLVLYCQYTRNEERGLFVRPEWPRTASSRYMDGQMDGCMW